MPKASDVVKSAKSSSKATSKLPLPPFVKSKPVVGNLIEFYRDRLTFLNRAMAEHGEIFAIRLGPRKVVVLLNPDDLNFVFMQNDLTLSVGQAYQFVATMFSPEYLYMADYDEYIEQRKVLLPAFQGAKLGNYLGSMLRELKDWMHVLGDKGEFDVVDELSKLALRIAARAFIGEDFRKALHDKFIPLFTDLSRGADPIFPANWPLPHLIRCRAARAELGRLVSSVFQKRRHEGGEYHDFIQYLLEARYHGDQHLPEEIMINMVLGIVWGGYETTTGTMSWALIHLLQNPSFLQKVVAEIDTVLATEPMTELDTWRGLEHLQYAFWETERLEPVSDILLRYNVKGYEIGGYHVPAGWYTVISPSITQRLPRLYSHPNAYDPLRHAPGREEQASHRFSQLAFGGGLHKCPGMNFAHTEMKVVMGMLLHEYDLVLIDRQPDKLHSIGIQRPGACRVRYQRRTTGGLNAQKTSSHTPASLCPVHPS